MRSRGLLVMLMLWIALVACRKRDEITQPERAANAGPAYLGVNGVGLVRVSAEGSIEQLGPKISQFYELEVAPDGSVWAATLNGLFHIRADGFTPIESDGDPLHIDLRPDGTLVAATYTAVRIWDGSAWTTVPTTAIPRDEINDVKRVLARPDGLWLFTFGHAWHQGEDGEWVTHDPPAPLRFRGLSELPNRDALLVISDAGVYVLDEQRAWTRTSYEGSPPTASAAGPDGEIYFKRPRGKVEILSLEGSSLIRQRSLENPNISFVADAMAVDERGRIWQSDPDNGLSFTGANGTTKLSTAGASAPEMSGRIMNIVILDGGPTLAEPK